MSIKRGDETFVDATGNQYDFMLAPAGGHGLLAVASGDAAPSDGPWLQGDIMWNSDPDSGDPVGWVCTMEY